MKALKSEQEPYASRVSWALPRLTRGLARKDMETSIGLWIGLPGDMDYDRKDTYSCPMD